MPICSCHVSHRPWLHFSLAVFLALGFGPFGLFYRQARWAGMLLLCWLVGTLLLLGIAPTEAFVLFLFYKALYLTSVGLAIFCAWPLRNPS